MDRRDFLKLSSVAGASLYLPWLTNPTERIIAPPRGWGLSIASQYHSNEFYGLDETLSRFQPTWWHNWTWEPKGCCPAFWRSSVYLSNMAAIDAAAQTWTHVLWTNEPELQGGEAASVVAQGIATFRDHNPHVTVYGFGCVLGLFDPDDVAAQWLTEYRKQGVALDAWHWHIYPREPSGWAKAWDNVRRLSGDLPIVLTEYASPYPSEGETWCMEIMDKGAETLQSDKQLQGLSWFCARPIQPEWQHTSLLDAAGNTTAIGRHWLEWQREFEGRA